MKDAADALKDTAEAVKDGVEGRIIGYGGSKYPPLNSAFITFNKQIGAHMAMQALAHHDPYRMSARQSFFFGLNISHSLIQRRNIMKSVHRTSSGPI